MSSNRYTDEFSWFSISNSTDSMKFATNLDVATGATPDVFIADIDGLFDPGKKNAEPKARVFANGSILPLRATFEGKVINVTFQISNNISANVRKLQGIVSSPIININTDWLNSSYTATLSQDGYTTKVDPSDGSWKISCIFTCKEAF